MHRFTGRQLREQFIAGKLTAEKIASHFLERIRLYDPQVKAYLAVFSDRVLQKARALDEKRKKGGALGKLAAIPIAIKDNIHVNGELTTCASKFLANYRAVFDATATHLLEAEDALILGKTNMDEFGMGSSNENSAFFPSFNPWDLERVPGGSSGGSTAAVAARLCSIALGSDTGGSVRQPAAFCGVYGLKPTYGRVSRYGLVAFASSLDTIGPIAAASEDIALAMEVLGTHDPHDATSLPLPREDYLVAMDGKVGGKVIGVPWEFLKSLQPEVKQNFLASLEVLKQLGCTLVDVDLNILKYSIATYYIICTAEASTNLARFDGIRYGVRSPRAKTLDEVYEFSKGEGFGPEVKRRILLGTYVLSSGYQHAYYKKAMQVRVRIIDSFNAAFAKCAAIATPVSPIVAFKSGAIHDPLQMYLQDIYTIGINLARLPAMSVPAGFNQEGMPLGLQLIGDRHQDLFICRLAHAFEKATGFGAMIPKFVEN